MREGGRAGLVVEAVGAVAGRAEVGAVGKRNEDGGGDFLGDARD